MSFLIVFLIVLSTCHTSNAEGCGLPLGKNANRVMGGEMAPDGAWPWMVSINLWTERTQPSMCSGFLIHEKHVMTAAHCFDEHLDPALFSVRAGSVDLSKATVYRVEEIFLHDNYKTGIYEHDIAILRLHYPVYLHFVNTICLPTEELSMMSFNDGTAALAGWGAFSYEGPSVKNLYQLKDIPLISNEECNEAFSSRIFKANIPNGITENHICAGFPEGGKDGCRGDSGAPLMYFYNGKWHAIGLVSFGYNCGVEGYPAVFTRITSYLLWILGE